MESTSLNTTSSAPIAIIVAMESERTHLEQLIPGWIHRIDGVWPVMRTTWRGVELIALRSGIGMVAAAAAAEYAMTTYAPGYVLNFGCAGAHRREDPAG